MLYHFRLMMLPPTSRVVTLVVYLGRDFFSWQQVKRLWSAAAWGCLCQHLRIRRCSQSAATGSGVLTHQ